MFHHFKGGNHIEGQGAITQEQFQQIIEFLKKNYNLIGAAEFNDKCEKNKLASGDVVLSFDDGLKCQYDLALDVLDFYKIDAYFFIYSNSIILCEIHHIYCCYKRRNIILSFLRKKWPYVPII